MANKRVPLEAASLEQLREYAVSTCGLEVSVSDTADEIRAAIALAQPGLSDITVSADEPEQKPRVAKPAVPKSPKPLINSANETSGAGDRMIRIIIQNQEGAGGSEPVPVGVNGTVILIPRDKPVEVPARYVEALRRATRIEYSQDADQNLIPRHVLQYPFTLASADMELV